MSRTPSRPPRSERAQASPYARPAGQVESQSSQSNGLRRSTSLASSLSGFGRSLFSSFRSNPGPVLPQTSRDLGNSEDGSEEEAWNGEPPQARRGITPPSPEIVVAEIRRSGHPVPVMQLARSLSGGSPPNATTGSSRRQQAQLALRQRSAQLDPSQPDYGLGNRAPITPTPTFPGSFATQQNLSSVAGTSNVAGSSSRAIGNGNSNSAAGAGASASRSPFSLLSKSISRIISPPSTSTPTNKRSRETTTPSQPPPSNAAASSSSSAPLAVLPLAPSGPPSGFASFLPVAQTTPAVQVARSRAEDSHVAADALKAYQAYMKAKPVEQLDADDYRMIAMLSQKAAQELEQNATAAPAAGTPARQATSTPSRPAALGTWAANTFEGTPRLIRPLPSNPGTPGTVFSAPASPSFGAGTPGSAVGTPRGQKVYLGPGMSSRRLNASTSRSNLSNSTTPFNPNNSDDQDEVEPKRRRVDSAGPASQLSRSSHNNTPSSSVPPVPAIPVNVRMSAAAIGRKSASNIMAGLIDDIAPELARPMVIVNPYDRPVPRGEASGSASQASAPGTPGVRAMATPAKSALRKGKAAAQAESTPSRGAAARIAQTPSTTPLPTTLELLQGTARFGQNGNGVDSGARNGGEEASGRKSGGRRARIETPERERDDNEVDDLVGESETPSKTTNSGASAKPLGFGSSTSASSSPSAPFVFGSGGTTQARNTTASGSAFGQQPQATQPEAPKKPAEEPKKTEPLPAPTLGGLPSFGTPSKPSSSSDFGSSEPTMSFGTFTMPVVQPASPAFKPTAVKAPEMPESAQWAPSDSAKSAATATVTTISKGAKQDTRMTAKELAQKVDEAALPFFTYNVPASSSTPAPSKAVQSRAAAATLPSFSFTPNAIVAPSASASTSAPAAPTGGGFNWAAAGGKAPTQNTTDWTCNECTLKSPASAQKCIACEAARPTSAPTPAQNAISAPAPPVGGGFNWAAAGGTAPTQNSSDWTCGECTLKSPASAQKCIACDTARPTPAPAQTSTSAPAAATTGFNWAAAGAAPPRQAAGWTCSTCMCQNGVDDVKCVVCETPK